MFPRVPLSFGRFYCIQLEKSYTKRETSPVHDEPCAFKVLARVRKRVPWQHARRFERVPTQQCTSVSSRGAQERFTRFDASSSEYVVRVRGPPKLTKNDEQFLRKLPPYLSLESNDVLAMLLTQAIARECHGRAECASMFDSEWTIKAKGRYGSIIKTIRLEFTDGDKKERAEAGRGFREWLSSRFTVL